MGEPSSRRGAAVLMAGYCVLLLVVLLGPVSIPSDGVSRIGEVAARLGVPEPLRVPSRVEFIVNVGVIAPAAAVGSVVWPRTTWRDWTAYGFLFSAAIELTRALLLPVRALRRHRREQPRGALRRSRRTPGQVGRRAATLTRPAA